MASLKVLLSAGISAVMAASSSPAVDVPRFAAAEVPDTHGGPVIDGGEVLIEEGLTAPGAEAEAIADELHELSTLPEVPTLSTYDVRYLDETSTGEFDSLETATAQFPLPEGCSTAEGSSLRCADGSVFIESAVYDANGAIIDSEMTIDATGISVSVDDAGAAEFPLSFTTFAADADAAPLLDDVVETLSPMMAEDATAENSRAPLSNSRPPKVTIPSDYEYCPNSCEPTARHDYCTRPALNYWRTLSGSADFRGPCARHDMMITAVAAKEIPLDTKRAERLEGDRTFAADLRQNCRYGFHQGYQAAGRMSCIAASGVYFVAVKATTARWDGQ